MKHILKPRSVAVIGASDTPGKIGNTLAQNLITYGYAGDFYFVNPKGGSILGRDAYTSLQDASSAAGGHIDVALIAVPAQYVNDIVEQGSPYCKNYVIISAGFGESDVAGHNREVALAKITQENDLSVIGPNCLGFITPSLLLNASFAAGLPESGSVALVSQSGALAVAFVDRARDIGIGFSSVVSIGNKMDVDAAQLIAHFANDSETHVITLYLESIKHGSDFLLAAQQARRAGKVVVLLKAGKSTQAQSAIALHTGSLAGDDAVTDAACRDAGIVRVNTIGELFAATRLAQDKGVRTFQHSLHLGLGVREEGGSFHARVGVVTNAGGPGVITTDAIAQTQCLCIDTFEAEAVADLKDFLPSAASVHNPIDLLGDAMLDRYEAGIDFCLGSKDVDIIMVLLTPQKNTPAKEVAQRIIDVHESSDKIIVASFIGGEGVAEARKMLCAAGVLHFDTPTEAVAALEQLFSSVKTFKDGRKSANDGTLDVDVDLEHIQRLIADAANSAAYFSEASAIAKSYGIPVSDFTDVTDGLHMDTQYPCVVKVDHPGIMHKSDRGGVILPIGSAAQLDESRNALLQRFPEEGVRIIAQPMRKIQTELIVGMKRDATFGPVILVGMGGIYTEILKASQLFLRPLSKAYIVQELKRGPLAFLFNGARGQAPYDAQAVAGVVLRLMRLSTDMQDIVEIDINPLLIYNEPQPDQLSVCAVDVKMVYAT